MWLQNGCRKNYRLNKTGYTGSANFPPFGMDFGAEIIISRISADGGALEYTYSIDSGSANRGNGIAVNSQGEIYFSGTVGVPASIYLSKLEADQVSAVNTLTPRLGVLEANYPNPFNPRTTISFELENPAVVRIQVFDATGHFVQSLLAGKSLGAGHHEVAWQGRDASGNRVASGVYFYRLTTNLFSETRSMVLLK